MNTPSTDPPLPDESRFHPEAGSARLRADDLRALCLEAGASDAGFVEIDRPALAQDKPDILRVYPKTRTLAALVFAMNPENIRSPARHASSEEFHNSGDELRVVSRAIVRKLNALGVRAVMANQDFPMDMGRFPGKIWDVSHKLVAVEAGLGHMGVNRLVIHPKFGNFLRLTSLLLDAEVDQPGKPLAESPCIRCGLCAAVCPVGAVSMDKPFDLMTCMTHAYRDNAAGFLDFIDSVIASPDLAAYRLRFRDNETASLWQSLMYKMNYRCGYCMAVCPAGRDRLPDYETRKKDFVREIVAPLKNRPEQVYVLPGSPAEARARATPGKDVRPVVPHVVRKA